MNNVPVDNLSKRVVVVHEATPSILGKDLAGFDIITFDDGLYSQFLHLDHFLSFGKPLYFFISTAFVCPEGVEQDAEAVYSGVAHKAARDEGDYRYYMTWEQIQTLHKTPNCVVGGHSHMHTRITDAEGNIEDTDTMLKQFAKHGIDIDSYCFPYNVHNTHRHASIVDRGIVNIFGKERTWAEDL